MGGGVDLDSRLLGKGRLLVSTLVFAFGLGGRTWAAGSTLAVDCQAGVDRWGRPPCP